MNKKKILLVGLSISMVYFVVILLLQIVSFELTDLGRGFYVPSVIVLGILVVLIFQILYSKYGYPTIYIFSSKNVPLDWNFFIGIAVSIVIVHIVGLLVYMYGDIFLEKEQLLSFIFGVSITEIVFMFAPGVSEEILMRAGLLHVFLVIDRPKLGLVISSSIFGLLHILNLLFEQNPFTILNMVWIVNIMLMGFLLGYLYIHYGIIVAIFFHWLWNASFGEKFMKTVEQSFVTSLVVFTIIILGGLVLRHGKQKYILLK